MADQHNHTWTVVSTALATVDILVTCDCGAYGAIGDSTIDEWRAAFHAPSEPYEWQGGNERVSLLPAG